MRKLTLYLLSTLAIGAGAYLITPTRDRSKEVLVAPQEQVHTDSGTKYLSCSLIDGMPKLENPEAVRCTNNGSQKIVVNIWDQDHDNPEIQSRVQRTIEEIVEKWEVKLVAREGFHGLEKSLPDEEKLKYSLLQMEEREVISVGVDPLYAYWQRLLGMEMDSWSILEQSKKQAERCYEKSKADSCYKLDNHKELVTLVRNLEREVGRLNSIKLPEDIRKLSNLSLSHWGLSDYVAYNLRSYAATDGILEVMDKHNISKAVLSYGAAHALQIDGYLDHLGISHIDIILDESLFNQRMEGLRQEESSTFSLKGLEDYKKRVAGKSFD